MIENKKETFGNQYFWTTLSVRPKFHLLTTATPWYFALTIENSKQQHQQQQQAQHTQNRKKWIEMADETMDGRVLML